MTEPPGTPSAWVYLLRCGRDGALYCGWTNDLDRRLRVHQSGKGARYTRSRQPVELAAALPMPDASTARREEVRIKRLSRRQKLALVARAEAQAGASTAPAESPSTAIAASSGA